MNTHFVEPLDVLLLRGNKLFGDAGSYGESMVPPWPSAMAGAIRSAIMVRDGVDLEAFRDGKQSHPTLGGLEEPGKFRVLDFQLAWRGEGGDGALDPLYPLPADLGADEDKAGLIKLNRLTPWNMQHGIACSIPTAQLPVMARAARTKPLTGLWLTARGLQAWLEGGMPDPGHHLVTSKRLWANDERVGIGLDAATRRASDGKLFTIQAVALRKGVGFVTVVEGDTLADGTTLRFGGDGRGAVVQHVEASFPQADLAAIAAQGRCRILLTTPGIFPDGWRLPGMAEDGRFELMGVRGRVVAAALSRAETVSGWDLARWQPKPAQRAAPTGSIYWLEELEATPDQLRKLADHGLWPETGYDASRWAEGFNRFTFATY